MMMINDIPKTQGKMVDMKKLFEPKDMHLKLAEEVKLNIENTIDQPCQVSRKAMIQIR